MKIILKQAPLINKREERGMEKYQTPRVELVELAECDVLTSSGTPLIPYSRFEDYVNEHEL